MEKGIFVKDINNTLRKISGLFLASHVKKGTTSRGDPYWSLTLSDSGGSIDAKIWPPLSEQLEITGGIARIDGNVNFYKNDIQIIITRYAPISENEKSQIAMEDFLASPCDANAIFQELYSISRQEFIQTAWHDFIFSILNDENLVPAFKAAPAAKKIHHPYPGGLLEHTLGVFKLCRLLAGQFPQLDRQILLAGAICHDLGKIREFSGGLDNDYTSEGRLLGHIFLGLEMIGPHLDASSIETPLREHLKHLILSHHGCLEFGSPCLPQTAEAFALHFADDLDAKMAIFRQVFENGTDTVNGAWSDFQKSLNRMLYNPRRSDSRAN